MKIAVFDKADYSELLDIFNDARASAAGFPGNKPSLLEFGELISGEIILVARIFSQIVGFVSVWEAENFIHHLYVKTNLQNKGIGLALLDACKDKFGLPLSLKCPVANQRACAFYQKNGWKVCEERLGPEGEYFLFRID